MATITQEELALLANEAGEKIREVLLPFMRAGVDVSISRDPKNQFYLADFMVPGQTDLKYQVLLGIPVFEGQWCGRLPIFYAMERIDAGEDRG